MPMYEIFKKNCKMQTICQIRLKIPLIIIVHRIRKMASNMAKNALEWLKVWHLNSSKEIWLMYENYIYYPIFVIRNHAKYAEFKDIFVFGNVFKIRKITKKQQNGASILTPLPMFTHRCTHLGTHLKLF